MPWEIFHWHALFAGPETIFWKVFIPPVLYGLHGYWATWMAVGALFHPYEAKFIPGTNIQLPLTPGIFPKRQAKLAQAVASTITDTLLTPADIKVKVEALLTEENIYLSVDLFVESVLTEFRDTAKLHRLASDIAELSPTLLNHLIESTIESIERGKDRRVAQIAEKIFDQVIVNLRIPTDQAVHIADRFMDSLITPLLVRNAFINVLNSQNINTLDQSIQAHASGLYKVLARIIGVKRICYEWKNFLESEPEESQKLISDLIKRFGIRDQIVFKIANFDLVSLPLQTITNLKDDLVAFVESFLVNHKYEILQAAGKIENEAMVTVRSAIIRFNPESVPTAWVKRVKQDLATFVHSYLTRELGVLLEKAIPALGMYSLIARKIDLLTSKQIEELVQRICRQELRALELFGGLIGFVLGLIQILVNAIAP